MRRRLAVAAVCIALSVLAGNVCALAHDGPAPLGLAHIWDEAAETERCNTAPLAEIGFDPSHISSTGLIRVVDLATFGEITLDPREMCRQQVPLTPDPDGDMCASFTVRNRQIEAAYFEKEVNGGSIACLVPVSLNEAELRLAIQKRARARKTGHTVAGLSRGKTCSTFNGPYSAAEVGPPKSPGERLTDDQKVKAIGVRARLLAQLTADNILQGRLRSAARLVESKKWKTIDEWNATEEATLVNERCGSA